MGKRFGMIGTAAAILGASCLLTMPAGAQVLGGYGQRQYGPSPGTPQAYTPSWAAPQQTPAWATQQRPLWAGPQQSPTWAMPQTPSWAQTPQPGYRRSQPIINTVPVTPGSVINRPSSPLGDAFTPGQAQLPSVEYRRRVTVPNPGVTGGPGIISHPITPVPVSNAPVLSSQPPSFRVTTPVGQRILHTQDYSNFVYNAPISYVGGPALLGGYYYGNYCDVRYDNYCYPSVYGAYFGLPQYIYNPGVIVVSAPYYPEYAAPAQPFYAPIYQVTYNENNYYVASDDKAKTIESGGTPAAAAIKTAFPADSYQAAFADIERAWRNNDPVLIDRHLRDKDTKLSIYVGGKYSYSLASGDFLQITRDAFSRLATISFDFTRLRKAKNGDVTAFGKHVYRASGVADTSTDSAEVSDTVPFSPDGSQPYDKSSDPATGEQKTIYVSYTLRQTGKDWYIIGVDSSPTDLVK